MDALEDAIQARFEQAMNEAHRTVFNDTYRPGVDGDPDPFCLVCGDELPTTEMFADHHCDPSRGWAQPVGMAVWYPGDDDTEPELDPWGYPDHPQHDTYEEQAGDR